jgi:hypothetical protein
MLIDFETKVTQLFVTNPSLGGGSINAGMSDQKIPKKVAQFASELVAQFHPE